MFVNGSDGSVDSCCLTWLASGLSMLDCSSGTPLVRAMICGSLARKSPGMTANSPVPGRPYLSKAISAGWPSAPRSTWRPNRAVSTPLSLTARLTGVYMPASGSTSSRAARMSGLLLAFCARWVL